MSTLWLKALAVIAMLADHIGWFSRYGFSEYGEILRGFGRIAFPVYCYLIAFGYQKTHNKYRYLTRLLLLGLISELPFTYCFWGRPSLLSFSNVYYTLSLGLLAIVLFDLFSKSRKEYTYIALLPVILAALSASFLGTDYGIDGVLLIFFFHIAGKNKIAISIVGAAFAARKFIWAAGVGLYNLITTSIFNAPAVYGWDKMQLFAVFALIPILLCNGTRGYNPKSKSGRKIIQYSFYFFYPVHLLIIGLIMRNHVM